MNQASSKQPGSKSESTTTSLSLLERAKCNDEQAWERIVTLYSPLVYRLCRISNIQADDARDIAQEVFRSAHRSMDRFQRDRPGDRFRAWLLTITRNKIRDYVRQRKRDPAAAGGTDMLVQIHQIPDLDWESSTGGSEFDSRSNLAKRAITLIQGDFAERTWNAFWETTIEGRDPEEVAKQLGISKWSVYQAKSRVLRRLREELDGLED